jgi:hypothetical protein
MFMTGCLRLGQVPGYVPQRSVRGLRGRLTGDQECPRLLFSCRSGGECEGLVTALAVAAVGAGWLGESATAGCNRYLLAENRVLRQKLGKYAERRRFPAPLF